MLRVWPYLSISYITCILHDSLFQNIAHVCVCVHFSLNKSKANFISCYVCDAKFVHHVVYFIHWK